MKNVNLNNRIGVILIISLILLINATTLMRFPQPHGDEAWMASRAWEFLQTGRSFGELDKGVLDKYEGFENYNPWLSTAIQSIGVIVFGSPSLLAIRFVSMFVGFLLLFAVYWIGLALDGKQLGLLGVVFTTFSLPFFLSAHFGRSDIIATAFGFTGIALHINNRSRNVWLSALAGLIVALAFEVHPHAAIYGSTMLVLFFYKYRWSMFQKPDFWGFIVGGIIGFGFFLYLHIFPNPQTFMRLTQLGYSFTRTPPLFTGNLAIILYALIDMVKTVIFVYPQIIIGLWAVVRFRKYRPSYITILVIMNVGLLLSFALLIRNQFLYYAIYFSPGLSLLIAGVFNDLLKSPIKTQYEYRFRQLIVALVVILPLVPVLRYDLVENYKEIQIKVNLAVKPTDAIMGNQLYWFGLRENKYLSWENLVFYRRDQPGSNLKDALFFLKPDIFILDGQVRNFILDEENENMYFQQLSFPKSELELFLNQYAKLETTIEDHFGNSLQMYRINWENSIP